MEELRKAILTLQTIIKSHKYISRTKDKDGKWKYEYATEKKGRSLTDVLKGILQKFKIGKKEIVESYKEIKKDFDCDVKTYVQNLDEYLNNKEKYDAKFSQPKKPRKPKDHNAPKKPRKPKDPNAPKAEGKKDKIKVKRGKIDVRLIRKIAEKYNGIQAVSSDGKEKDGYNEKQERKNGKYDNGKTQGSGNGRNAEKRIQQNGSGTENQFVQQGLPSVLKEKLDAFYNIYRYTSGLLEQKKHIHDLSVDGNDFTLFEDIGAEPFYTALEYAKKTLKSGDLVDLHSVDDYRNCRCFLTSDGLSGFAITKNGDLISVFNNNSAKRGFLRAISDIIKTKVKTLDCYASKERDLSKIYSDVFGFKTVALKQA